MSLTIFPSGSNRHQKTENLKGKNIGIMNEFEDDFGYVIVR